MTPPDGQARHLLIRGVVQGVGYRDALRQTATRLGLRGWCRNLLDGRVEALAYGEPQALQALETWCEKGPPAARVAQVLAHDIALTESCEGFEIRFL